MKAYTQGITKEEFVNEMRNHQELDNFIKGTYDEDNKGCAVGCSLKSIAKIKNIYLNFSNHKNFETYLGIPEWLALLEDKIFEGISDDRSKTWPVEFSEAINSGSDLNKIKTPFIIYILKSNLETLNTLNSHGNDQVKDAIEESKRVNELMIHAYEFQDEKLINEARSAAEAAATSARSAAWSAEAAAEAAARSAWSAARSAVEAAPTSARLAAWSADAAWSAAWSADAAESAAWSAAWSAAAWSAESAVYEKFAKELLRLIRECK